MSGHQVQPIDDLRAYLRDPANNDLYVINKSHLNGKRKRSECVLTISSEGQNVHIVVKDTYIPQNIGLKVANLMCYARSEDFQRYIDLGFLEPIDPLSAQEYLKTPEAKGELLRLSDMAPEDDLSTGSVSVAAGRKINASPKVVSIMMNEMDATRKISALKNIASEITPDDIKFIAQNAKDERVKAWAISFQK
jgi:hypothetical protein